MAFGFTSWVLWLAPVGAAFEVAQLEVSVVGGIEGFAPGEITVVATP